MKDFELSFTHRNNGDLVSHNKVEANDLVELLAQFLLVIARIQKEIKSSVGITDDDIPF